MMKKWLAILCTVLMMVLCCAPVSALETDMFEYEVLEDGTVSITQYKHCFNEEITALVIPSEIDGYTVSTIGHATFLRAFSLETVIVPDTVKVIESSAFQQSALKQIFLPEGLLEVHCNAFYWCDSMTHVVVPSTVTYLDAQAFGYTNLPAFSEDGYPVIPGVPGLQEGFVLYGQNNATVKTYAEENGIAYKEFSEMGVGDVDLNGILNTADVRTALKFILAGFEGAWYTGDVDGDGIMTTADMRELIVARLM